MNDDDILDYIEDSRNLRALGTELEFAYDENDMLILKQYVEPTRLQGITEGLQRVAGTTASIGAGAVGATLGFPTDLASLFVSIGKSVGAEDGKKLETFANTFETLSKENYGSQFYKGLFDNLIDDLNISDQKKKDFKAGFIAGEFLGLGGTGREAAKKAPAVAKSIRETSEEVGEAAQKRVAENQGSMTMSSMGVGEMGNMVDKGLSKLSPSNIMEDTKLVLEKRAEQMKLPPKERIMPSGQNKLFDTSEDAYKKLEVEQKETPVPRKTEGQVYPLKNRAKPLEDKSDAIADVLAKRIIPFKGRNIQYFYNTSPIIQKAVELGIPRETAIEQLKKFSKNYAATSPRTQTEDNLRNATMVGVKQNLGIDIGKIIGPGGDGINEKGYPMIIGPEGLHRQLIEDTKAEGISFDKNPKPATFTENLSGNLEGVTVDTHAIRAVIDVLNELEPGSVPMEWIGGKTPDKTKKFQAMYKKDSKSLDVSTMVRDGLASQALNKISKQTEYAVFSDIYKKVAEKAGVKPAEAQSLSWFANGEKTGLASEPKTIVELIEDRIDVTSQLTNMNKEEVFKKFMQGKMPLLSLGGITLLETGTSMENE